MPAVFKWGHVVFDDYTLAKVLILPNPSDDDTPLTLHDEAGDDYDVPANHIFVAGKISAANTSVASTLRLGESNTADGVISKEVIAIPNLAGVWSYTEVFGVYAAGKYVTMENLQSGTGQEVTTGAIVYGVEIDIS